MVAEEPTLEKFIAPITAEVVAQGMDKDWPVIKDNITRIMDIDEATKDHLLSLNIFHLGFSPDHSNNPTTVLITVDYASPESKWGPIISDIETFLKRYRYVDLKI